MRFSSDAVEGKFNGKASPCTADTRLNDEVNAGEVIRRLIGSDSIYKDNHYISFPLRVNAK